MSKLFSSLGKTTLLLVLFALTVGGGYWLGRTGTIALGPPSSIPQAATTESPQQFIPDTLTPTDNPAVPTDTLAPVATKIVSAGASASAGLAFAQYALQVPLDWTVNHEYDWGIPTDALTVSQGAYEIKIYQAATGGGACLFPGDTPFDGPGTNYSTIVAITGSGGAAFRRGSSAGSSGSQGFTVCQKTADGSYQAPTSFGHISYSVPAAADPATLSQMDAIIGSLTRQ